MSRYSVMASLALAFALFAAGSATAQEAETRLLSERLAEGTYFAVVTKRGSVPLQEGDWQYPDGHDYWTAFFCQYDPESGIWTSDVVGFTVRGPEYHACPPDLGHSRFQCGGVHSLGHRLERRITPLDHVLVVLENELTFDETGNVYLEGEHVGVVTIPPHPY